MISYHTILEVHMKSSKFPLLYLYYCIIYHISLTDVKRSVAERKEQITRKLSQSKIPASKQKKEIREEIIEIKTQIKPDIKKFQDIEQQVKMISFLLYLYIFKVN